MVRITKVIGKHARLIIYGQSVFNSVLLWPTTYYEDHFHKKNIDGRINKSRKICMSIVSPFQINKISEKNIKEDLGISR